MQNYTRPRRVKYTQQINLLLTEEELRMLNHMAENFRGTNSQVLRLALHELNKNWIEE